MFIRLASFIALLPLASAGTAPAPADAQGGPIKIGLQGDQRKGRGPQLELRRLRRGEGWEGEGE